jgi:hypothetical protein
MKADYEPLLRRLKAARCPYKLYPARLRALELVTGERLMPQVAEVITMRLAAAGAPGLKQQFERDLETYGLLEAIGYFHSYPPLDEEFVENACLLYERFAALYLEHHEQIVTNDDPRVRAQIEMLRRFGDSREHVGPRAREPARRASQGIAAPQVPPATPGYERQLGRHPDLVLAGIEDEVSNLTDELIEHFTADFMFEGFPGIQVAFFEVARALDDHGVDVFGPEGQHVLNTLVHCAIADEMFGDFERWIPCAECGTDFRPDVTLTSVNDSLLVGGWLCDECQGSSIDAGQG